MVSDRAAMKRRVRGLLHKNWLSPLLAVVLALVPFGIVCALVVLFAHPASTGTASVQIVGTLADPMSLLLQLLGLFSDPQLILQPLSGWLPMLGILLCLYLFIGGPIAVSMANYFLSFLRGKKPNLQEVYGSFSGQYPRALGGMAYSVLWRLIWFVLSFVIPTVLLFATVPVVSAVGIDLKYQVYIFIGVLILCAIWYIVFFFLFINRMLAYSLTSVCIAAQPRLAAYRGIRLSRKLMQGNKWRLIGLFASFLHYFIPAIVAVVALLVLGPVATQLSLAEGTVRVYRTILIIIIAANQLVWLYLAPYVASSYYAFYIERKREALIDQELTQADFYTPPRPGSKKAIQRQGVEEQDEAEQDDAFSGPEKE